MTPRVVFAGDAAVVAEFDERIGQDVNDAVVACARAISEHRMPGVRDVVPTFRSVTVYFDPLRTDMTALTSVIERAAVDPVATADSTRTLIEIPVCYDQEFGLDLPDVARFAALPVDAVIETHVSQTYRVYMLGFVPGFAYMATVDNRIAAPRRPAPRPRVEPGSVGIAGHQTGIYPSATPGGWNIVGRTPIRFAVDADHARSRLHCGDEVRFVPIDRTTYERLAAEQEFAA